MGEQTIAEHDKERGTRQKINEPDTPFEHELKSTDEDEEEDENHGHTGDSSGSSHEILDVFGELHARLSYHQYKQNEEMRNERKMEQNSTEGATGSHVEAETVSIAAAIAKQEARSIDEVSRFKEKRAGHYGRINLKELRKMQEEE